MPITALTSTCSAPSIVSPRVLRLPALLERLRSRSPLHASVDSGFKYGAELPARHIRLLRILPESFYKTVSVELIETALDTEICYNAVSYAWGDMTTKRALVCNGQRVQVTASLYEALWHYRNRGIHELLWADALCINQANPDEKNTQVRMMQEIYQKANHVIIWLGQLQEDDEIGLKLIFQLREKMDLEDIQLSYFRPGQADPKSLIPSGMEQYLNSRGLPQGGSPDWRALCGFYSKPWFRCVWVVQEFLSAKEPVFWIGHYWLSPSLVFDSFHILMKYCQLAIVASETSLEPEFWKYQENVGRLWSLKQQINDGTKFSLYQLVYNTRYFEATEPRDKIFAFVAWASDVDSFSIDYNHSLEDVLRDFTISTSFSGRCSMALFSQQSSITRSVQCPSWVINVSSFRRRASPFHNFGCDCQRELFPDVAMTSPLYGPDDTMIVTARKIDNIQIIKQMPEKLQAGGFVVENSPSLFAEVASFNDECFALATQRPLYLTGETSAEAYCMTSIFNAVVSPYQNVPPADFVKSYHAWSQLQPILGCTLAEVHDAYLASQTVLGILVDFAMLTWAAWFLRKQVPTPFPFIRVVYKFVAQGAALWFGSHVIGSKFLRYLNHRLNEARNSKIALLSNKARLFGESFGDFALGHQFAITEQSRFCWVPDDAQVGDEICLFGGCIQPVAVRKRDVGYELLGDCYVHGFMRGEPHVVSSYAPRDMEIV